MSEEEKNISENEEPQSFKVSDRRYSVTGYDAEEVEEKSDSNPIISSDNSEPSGQTENVSELNQEIPEEVKQSPDESSDIQSEESKEEKEEEEDEKHFEMMIAILQANALGAMGLHPQTGEKVGSADPRAAKLFVDLFGMLEEKMKGNLTEEEADILKQVRSNMQVAYVQHVGIG
tara:strand:+ start:2297 stop:2821 length:525 start_codon:yes stop_codon:yes gene_type:complete